MPQLLSYWLDARSPPKLFFCNAQRNELNY